MYTLAVNSNDQRAINEWYVVHKHKHCECCVPVCGTHTRSSHAAHVNHMRNTLYVHARYLYVDCGHITIARYHCTITTARRRYQIHHRRSSYKKRLLYRCCMLSFFSLVRGNNQQLFPSVSLASLPLVFLFRRQDPGKKLS